MSVVRRVLEKFRLSEISAVDRPAQAHATMTIMKRRDDPDDSAYQALCKRSFTADERRKAAASGAAMPDGSYPIENRGDLANALHAIGRGEGSHATIREHIARRAQALGATDLLPDDWNIGKRLAISRSDDGALCIEHSGDADVTRALDAYAKSDGDPSNRADFVRYLTARGYNAADCERAADQLAAVLAGPSDDASDAEGSATAAAERDAHIEQNPLDENEDAFKSVGGQLITKRAAGAMFEVLKAQDEEIRKARSALAKSAEDKASTEFAKRATALGFGAAFGPTLRKAYACDATAQAEVEQRIAGLKKQVEEGALFDSFGKAGPQAGSAESELRAKAEELCKADPKLTREQAFAKVYTNRANAEIVKRYKRERASAH